MVNNTTHCYLSVYTEKFPSPSSHLPLFVSAFSMQHSDSLLSLWSQLTGPPQREGEGGWWRWNLLERKRERWREKKDESKGGRGWWYILRYCWFEERKRRSSREIKQHRWHHLRSFLIILILLYLLALLSIFISYFLAACLRKCHAMFYNKGVDDISCLFPKWISGENSNSPIQVQSHITG